MKQIDKLGITPYNGSYIITYDEELIGNWELSYWMKYNHYFLIQELNTKFNADNKRITYGLLAPVFNNIDDVEQAIEWIKSILIMNQLSNKKYWV